MGKRVLVIEDDPSAARLVEYALEKEGYKVDVAVNGVEGLRKVQEEEPDLIILDVMLPGLDGFEVCHRMRADPGTAHVPILMLSAKAHATDRFTGLKVGADRYLAKPADPAEILACVKSLLTEKGAAARTP
ncbi:MAG: response regulator [Chloroflexi bacterium]|nr:response regulator [Chloroflexota bacterium]